VPCLVCFDRNALHGSARHVSAHRFPVSPRDPQIGRMHVLVVYWEVAGDAAIVQPETKFAAETCHRGGGRRHLLHHQERGAPGTVPFQPKGAPPYLPKLNHAQHMREAGHGDVRSYFGTIFWSPLGDPGGGTTGIVESEDGDGLLIPASPTGGGRITPVCLPSR
jgi:hypothetical protein